MEARIEQDQAVRENVGVLVEEALAAPVHRHFAEVHRGLGDEFRECLGDRAGEVRRQGEGVAVEGGRVVLVVATKEIVRSWIAVMARPWKASPPGVKG